MAESKQYITQVRENGSVQISEDVISTIVAHAVSDVEGVVGLEVKPGADIAELIGKKNWGKGVKVTVTEQEELSIDCNVFLVYGQRGEIGGIRGPRQPENGACEGSERQQDDWHRLPAAGGGGKALRRHPADDRIGPGRGSVLGSGPL